MTKIKFCGLRHAADAAKAASLGASYGGVVLTESRRRVSSEEARAIFDAAPDIARVGVFGRGSVLSIVKLARDIGLDVLQLHGHFTAAEHVRLRDEFDGELWAVVPVDAASGALSETWHDLVDVADALLLDTKSRWQSGGTGIPFNWRAAARSVTAISRDIPVILAGGLTPANVAAAIAELRPATVDVSSGVESQPGVKSPELMAAFAEAVLSAS